MNRQMIARPGGNGILYPGTARSDNRRGYGAVCPARVLVPDIRGRQCWECRQECVYLLADWDKVTDK